MTRSLTPSYAPLTVPGGRIVALDKKITLRGVIAAIAPKDLPPGPPECLFGAMHLFLAITGKPAGRCYNWVERKRSMKGRRQRPAPQV